MPNVTLSQAQINAGLRSGFSLSGAQFTYSVPSASSTWAEYAPGEQPFVDYSILNAAQADAFRLAMAAWDALIAPNFTEVADNAGSRGEVRAAFTSVDMGGGTAAYAFQGSNRVPTSQVGDIWINASDAAESFAPGTVNYATLIHEIGHVLGLKHPFEGMPLPAPFENQRYTTLSYTEAGRLVTFSAPGPNQISSTRTPVITATPMVLDIAAIQALYGADLTTATGNDTYTFNQSDATLRSIYDAGGIDTFDLSSILRNSIVDLTPGGYSSVAQFTKAEQTAFWQAQFNPGFGNFIAGQINQSDTYEWTENVGIALATTIENVVGGAGNDTIIGNNADNLFNLRMAGNDSVSGGAGNDGFYFGNTLTAADSADGGAGTGDQLALQGQYPSLTLLAQHLVGIESLVLLDGSDTRFGDPGTSNYSYGLVMTNGAVAAGQNLTVNANSLRAAEQLVFNGTQETDGSFTVFAGFGSVDLIGGGGSDGFFFGDGRFGGNDEIIGGGGIDDQLGLHGNYASEVVFLSNTIGGVESIVLLSATDARFGSGGTPFSYALRTHDGNVAAGQSLLVTATTLAANETLTFNGANETNGRFDLRGGAGNDVLAGGAGNDSLYGGLGTDQMNGGAGVDTFVYRSSAESGIGAAVRDRISGFTTGTDKIDLSQIDANRNTDGNDAFTSLTMASVFTTGTAGALIYDANTQVLRGDTNGDSIADFEIMLLITPNIVITDIVL